jgi:hypothetical protein
MATSVKTKREVEAKDGVVALTTRDETGELVAQLRFSSDQAIGTAVDLLNAAFAAKQGKDF